MTCLRGTDSSLSTTGTCFRMTQANLVKFLKHYQEMFKRDCTGVH